MAMTATTTTWTSEPTGTTHLPAAWKALVPLWDRSSSGWFAFDQDGLLRYANRAVAEVTRRAPRLGSTELPVDVVPAGRRAVQQRWDALRSNQMPALDTVVPAQLDGEAHPLHLMVVAHDTSAGRWLVGTVRPVVHSDGVDARAGRVEHVIARVMAELLAVAPPPPDSRSEDHSLSPRQREILHLLSAGATTTAIAEQLSLSPHTVRNHTKAIFRAFGVHSRAELITRTRDRGADGLIDRRVTAPRW